MVVPIASQANRTSILQHVTRITMGDIGHQPDCVDGYVRDNMPYEEAYHHKPVLTDDEAWQVAAYINAQPRPEKQFPGDWPRIATKPVDHPFGPFSDPFSARQHKYGPFQPIVDYRNKNKQAP